MRFLKNRKEEQIEKLLQSQDKKLKKMEKMEDTHHEMLNNIFVHHTLQPTEFTQGFRDLSYELMKFMGNVCKKYELSWWIDYGTLLGGVRHGDFIPWDDDLDSGMMRKDYNVLQSVMPDEIEDNGLEHVHPHIKLDNHNKRKTKRWFQLRYNRPDFKGSFSSLDVFPYDYIKGYNGEDIEEKYNKLMWNYYAFTKDDDMTAYMEKYFRELNLTLDEDEYLISAVDSLRGDAGYATIYPFKIIRHDDIFPVKRINFGGCELPAPNRIDKYLTDIYGENYFQIPRKLRQHGVFEKNIKRDDIIPALKEGIEALKKANSKY